MNKYFWKTYIFSVIVFSKKISKHIIKLISELVCFQDARQTFSYGTYHSSKYGKIGEWLAISLWLMLIFPLSVDVKTRYIYDGVFSKLQSIAKPIPFETYTPHRFVALTDKKGHLHTDPELLGHSLLR